MHALATLLSRTCLFALGMIVPLPALAAYQFYLDSFQVARLFPNGTTDPTVIFSDTNGYVKFKDEFDAGGPPPDLTGVLVADVNNSNIGDFTYGVDLVNNGTTGPEVPYQGVTDLLSLNSANAVPNTSPSGAQRIQQFQLLNAELNQGLGKGVTFAVGAIYQWIVPEERHVYGIQVQDRTNTNPGDDNISLRIRGAGNGQATVGLVRSVYASNETGTEFQVGTNILQEVTLSAPNDAAFVGLWLNHATAGTDPLLASLVFLDVDREIISGSQLDLNSVDIFHGEATVYRPAFYALQPVPEPETWAMMLAGLGLVGLMVRRRVLMS